jgi:hypothetical protein
VEKRGKIALLRDGLADFEQGFELTPGVFERGGKRHFRRRNDGVRHRRQDNTRVGAGSTCGNRVSWLVSGYATYRELPVHRGPTAANLGQQQRIKCEV